MSNKKVHILGGGTISWIRSHFALSAPAYGSTAKKLYKLAREQHLGMDVELHLTKMAGGGKNAPETVHDVQLLIDKLVNDSQTKIIYMNVAMCDFEGYYSADGGIIESGKHYPRISSSRYIDENFNLVCWTAHKAIKTIRSIRKDIFLVGFKQTDNLTPDYQYLAGLKLLKESSCNLVLANDLRGGFGEMYNMVITPEEARYYETYDRSKALAGLVEIAQLRSHLTFTRSTVIAGEPVKWNSELVPNTLRTVVNYCINQGAYRQFGGSTVGHFAVKLSNNEFLTSMRKTNFNDLLNPESRIGLVKIKTDGDDTIWAYGAKPSVGGQSQRIVFNDHKEYDVIVHFHSPILPKSKVPVISQKEAECGSKECGIRTSNGLMKFRNLSAVYLDQHGPNIVFHSSIDPQEVITFIENNFDLSKKTGGYVSVEDLEKKK